MGECYYIWTNVVTELIFLVRGWRYTETSVVKINYFSVKFVRLPRLPIFVSRHKLEHQTFDSPREDVTLDEESCHNQKDYLEEFERKKCLYNRCSSPV